MKRSPELHVNTVLASNLFFLISSKLEVPERGEKKSLVFALQESEAVCTHRDLKDCMKFFEAHGRLIVDFVESYCQIFMT